MYFLGRLLVRSVIFRIIIGVLLLLGGIGYGLTSHAVSYQQAHDKSYNIHELEDGTFLFQPDGTNTFYIVDPNDFTPQPKANVLMGPGTLSIMYKDDTESVEYKSKEGNDVSGTGHRVEMFETADQDGKNDQIYKSAEYIQNPNGVTDNNWLAGGGMAAVGVLLLGLSLFTFMRRSKKQKNGPNPYLAGVNTPNQYNPMQTGAPNQYGQYGPPSQPGVPNQYGQYGPPSQAGVPNQYGQYGPPSQSGVPNQYGQYGPPSQAGVPNQYGQYGPGQGVEPTQYGSPQSSAPNPYEYGPPPENNPDQYRRP